MAEQALALSAFRLSQLPQDVQLSILLAFGIRELIICKRVKPPPDQYFTSPTLISSAPQMCRALAQLIDGDVSVRYKIELARAGRIDGPSSLAVRIVDRLASLHAQQTMFRAGDHPLARLRGTRFGSWDALPSSGFVTTVSDGVVHLWRPAAASGLGELKISYSLEELGSTGVEKSSCVGDVAQDLLVFSGKNLNTLSVQLWPDDTGRLLTLLSSLVDLSTVGYTRWPREDHTPPPPKAGFLQGSPPTTGRASELGTTFKSSGI